MKTEINIPDTDRLQNLAKENSLTMDEVIDKIASIARERVEAVLRQRINDGNHRVDS